MGSCGLAATGPGALAGSLLAARLPGRFGYGAVLASAAALGEGVMLAGGILGQERGLRVSLLATAAGMMLSPADGFIPAPARVVYPA